MKNKYKILSFVFIISIVLLACEDEEMRYIDPMIEGISVNVENKAFDLSTGDWGNALVGLKEQRVKLLNIQNLIATDSYSGENYSLENKEQNAQRVAAALQIIETKLDSIWNANIKSDFDAVNKNSAGIQNFGLKAYDQTSIEVTAAQEWLNAGKGESADDWAANDFKDLQSKVEVLTGLAALNDAEVIQFVNDLKDQFATMKQQYADIESEVNSSPMFSKAQKELYASLETPLSDMEVTIEENLSLSTKDQLDLINRDLHALVYFIENNYTSPAQAPKVFGEISSITELRWLSEVATEVELNGDWVLTTDIDAAETARWNLDDPDGRIGFRPIITPTSINFDGQFHIISGLYMTKIGGAEDANRSGLFTKIVDGSVRNLGLINLRMITSPEAGNGNQGGTLIGMITGSGSVTKCFVQGVLDGARSQTGGFIGRPQVMSGEISDCFSVVATSNPVNKATSSFIGLPVAAVNIYNCYNLGASDTEVHAIFGHGAGIFLNASGIYFDSETVGVTDLEHHSDLYSADTPVRLTDDGVTTDLPTAGWGDLSNFPGFSADTWEIRTETQFDPNPRPYLKGFNYEGIKDFIVPEN